MIGNNNKLNNRIAHIVSNGARQEAVSHDPDLAISPNKRKQTRQPTHHYCTVLSGDSRFSAYIKNLTHDGAMIQATGIHNITTKTAQLISYLFGTRDVRIIWRKQDLIGIKFIQHPDKTALGTQE